MGASYGWGAARRDALAGLTVAAIALPQAMAYALIAGIDPRYGLYSAIVVTAVASVFGSSSHLINGPTNAISLVVLSAVAVLHLESPDEIVEAVFLLAVLVGAIQILIAVFKLGDLTRYISESVVLGFMAGAAVLIAVSQVANLFGLREVGTGHHHILHRLWMTITTGGAVNARAVVVGASTVLVVLALRALVRRYHLPRWDMLVALVLIASLAAVLGWSHPGPDGAPAIAVIGDVPAGLPSWHVPRIQLTWIPELAGSALAVALLGLLEALAIAKSIAQVTHQRLDYNQQCLAEGLANFTGGFFQCLPGSGSLTRSAINFQSGAVSRMSGVFAALAVAVVVVLFASWAHLIPKAALAGILLVTAAGLFDWKRLGRACRASRYDASLVMVTAGAAILISVDSSILIGVALSILMFVPRAARLQARELVVSAERTLRDRQPTDPPCSHMVILDLEGEFFFGAAPELDRYLEDLGRRVDRGLRIVILRVKRTRNPDIVCMERLQHFLAELEQHGAMVLLAGVRQDFHQVMQNLQFEDQLPADHVFLEDPAVVGSATLSAVRYAYQRLGDDLCDHCPRRGESLNDANVPYYVI